MFLSLSPPCKADENYRIQSLGCLGADRFSEMELMRGKLDAKRYGEVIAEVSEDLSRRAETAGEAGADNFLLDFLTRWKHV